MTWRNHILAGNLRNPFVGNRLNRCAINRDRHKPVKERPLEFVLNTWLNRENMTYSSQAVILAKQIMRRCSFLTKTCRAH